MSNTEAPQIRNMNDLAAMMRIIGNLFYRNPECTVLISLYDMIFEGKIQSIWPLKHDDLFKRLEKSDKGKIILEYKKLFELHNAPVCLDIIHLIENNEKEQALEFINRVIEETAMPISQESNITHYGFLWLLLAWLETKREEQVSEQQSSGNLSEQKKLVLEQLSENQSLLFFDFILPLSKKILSKIETYSQNDFYKVLATITRDLVDEFEIELSNDELSKAIE
ncbi:hypothetical protein [Thorsellia kenyensis]|uniref:Uncharacterized protein n=1 Tax=Thorsellia kenyensis TaxID=1549888 RepID=A0ABV6C903_9GAMM